MWKDTLQLRSYYAMVFESRWNAEACDYENQTHYWITISWKVFRLCGTLLQAEYNQSGPLANFARYGIIVPLVAKMLSDVSEGLDVKGEILNGQRPRAIIMEKKQGETTMLHRHFGRNDMKSSGRC